MKVALRSTEIQIHMHISSFGQPECSLMKEIKHYLCWDGLCRIDKKIH